MMRGRRPKPTRIKALTGNPGKRPLNAHEPRPEPAAPECPVELSPVARQEWMRLTAELAKLNLITHLDRGALATYCGAYALGGGDGADPKIRNDGEIADGLSHAVAVSCHRQQTGRAYDAHCI